MNMTSKTHRVQLGMKRPSGKIKSVVKKRTLPTDVLMVMSVERGVVSWNTSAVSVGCKAATPVTPKDTNISDVKNTIRSSDLRQKRNMATPMYMTAKIS